MDVSPRYYDFSAYLSEHFSFKVQKISLNAGFTCPNRDGTVGYGGCTYCNNQTFNPAYCHTDKSVTEQLEEGKHFFARKYSDMRFLAYFQAYTNTYGELQELKRKYEEALTVPDVVGIVIGTRPDCMPEELLDYLEELNRRTFLIVEYGIESTDNETLHRINRGHTFEQAVQAVCRTAERGIRVGAHIILGLPGETKEMMRETISHVSELISYQQKSNDLPSHFGIKLQLLHILKDTSLASLYEKEPFPLFELEEYCDFIIDCLEILPPEMVIHRLTGDGPKKLLIAPLWSSDKKRVLNTIHKRLLERDTWQGKFFIKECI